MKKITLFLFFICCLHDLPAQTFALTEDVSGNPVVNGQVMPYAIGTSVLIEDTRRFNLHNISNMSVVFRIRRTNMVMNPANSFALFYTQNRSYSPTQTLSMPDTIDPSETFFFLPALVPEQYSSGICLVRYTIFSTANPNDSLTFDVEYNLQPTDINTNSFAQASISNPSPNPAATTFSMNYKLSNNASTSDLILYNMLGEKVMTRSLDVMEGNISVDVTTLPQGVYFCAIVNDKKTLATRRLVVTH